MSKRTLQFSGGLGEPMIARCSVCQRVFTDKPDPGESMHDMALRVRTKFAQHSCNEDASQAAARIVREATEE